MPPDPHQRTTLLFANEIFYRAFSDGDMTLMAAVWADRDDITCLHPGWPPVEGREPVLQSWHAILTNPSSPKIEILHPKVHIRGDCGTVICYEKVNDDFLIATNLFVRQDDNWLLVHHQSGPTEAPAQTQPFRPRYN